MDIGDCSSEFLMSISEDNPCWLSHFPLILYQTAIRRYSVQLKQYRQWRGWMRKNQEQPKITPVWVTSTTLLLPPRKKHGVIRKNSGNSTERTTKLSQLILYFIQLCQHKIYFTHTHTHTHTHTLLITQTQIRRECTLFIRRFSNWAFSTILTERQKQTI